MNPNKLTKWIGISSRDGPNENISAGYPVRGGGRRGVASLCLLCGNHSFPRTSSTLGTTRTSFNKGPQWNIRVALPPSSNSNWFSDICGQRYKLCIYFSAASHHWDRLIERAEHGEAAVCGALGRAKPQDIHGVSQLLALALTGAEMPCALHLAPWVTHPAFSTSGNYI